MTQITMATIMVAAALMLSGCDEQTPAQAGGAMPPPPVEVVTPQTMTQKATMVLPGRLQAVRSAEVRARVEGVLEKRLYQEGSDIKAGAALFQIDPKVLQANVQSAKASLMRAQADHRIAEQTAKRMATLVPEKAASQQDLDTANANVARAKADIEAAKAALSRAEIDLGYAKVTAPISGRIGRALVTEGALVGKGSATPLAVIDQMNPIWVDFALSSAQYAQLRAAVEAQTTGAAEIELLLSDKQAYQHKGKLLFADPAVDPSTGSVGLRAEFSNDDYSLLPGQFVSVKLPVSDDQDYLTIPQKSVQASPKGQIVMVVGAEGDVMPRPVQTGALINGHWVVLSGLEGSEQVIVNGLQKARPGTKVTPVPLAETAGDQ